MALSSSPGGKSDVPEAFPSECIGPGDEMGSQQCRLQEGIYDDSSMSNPIAKHSVNFVPTTPAGGIGIGVPRRSLRTRML